MKAALRLLGLLALAFAFGCGSKEISTYPVSGQVNYNGKPAAGVQVYFSPTSAPTVPDIPQNPHAVTGPDGRFTLTTFTPNDGAPEGGYQVILLWPKQTAEEEEREVDQLLGWYSAVHSKLTAQVKPSDNNLPAFNLRATSQPPGQVNGVPGRN